MQLRPNKGVLFSPRTPYSFEEFQLYLKVWYFYDPPPPPSTEFPMTVYGSMDISDTTSSILPLWTTLSIGKWVKSFFSFFL